MTLKQLIDSAVAIVERAPNRLPVEVPPDIVATELKKLRDWMYPDLETGNVQLVVKCYQCTHYRKFKKKDQPRSRSFFACDIDMAKRDGDFFCKDGVQK